MINNDAFANSEIIFNKNTSYYADLKFAGIGKITYIVDYYNNTLDKIPLYQTDGTIGGTIKVSVNDSDNIDVNIFNPIQLFVNNEILIITRIENNKRFISLLDTKLNRIYDVDTLHYSTFEDLYFFNFDSNKTLIHFNTNSSKSTKIYFLKTKERKLIPYNFPMKYYIRLIEKDKLVLQDTVGNISLINPITDNQLWSMNQSQLSEYNYWFFSKGIYLLNKDTGKKSLLVNYTSGIVDSMLTVELPDSFKPISLEYGVFSIFDSTIKRSSIIITDNNYKIMDTLSKNFSSYYVVDDYLYFFKISKSITKNTFYYDFLMDLYSYNFLTKKVELLIPDCVVDNYNFRESYKFKDGRIVFGMLTFNFGNELFVSDGTKAGTKMLKDINTGPFNGINLSYYEKINKSSDDDRYYFSASSPDYGNSVWQTDGSVEGTIPILSVEPAEIELKSKNPHFYVNNNKLFIQDNDYLYSSDIKQTDKVRKKYDYKIIDNIFSRETRSTTLSHFCSSSFFKDNQNNFYVTGQQDCTVLGYTFCYSNDQVCDTSIRDYRTVGYIMKYNQDGDRMFTKYINHYMFGDNIVTAVDSLLNIYCLYSHYDPYYGINNFGALTKFNKNGDSLWSIIFKPSEHIYGINCLETDKENNVYALFSYKGFKLASDSIILKSNISPEFVLFKISPNGKILEYKQFNHTDYFSKIMMSIINDKVVISFSSISEKGMSTCKYTPFSNIIYSLDLNLSVLNQKTFIGDDYNYLTSLQKGFGDDIIITGTYRGSLDLMGNVINSSLDGDCNLQTSYIALIDKDLNIKYVKNFNPDKYIINSAYLTKDNNIYTVGTCSSCKIDTIVYPDFLGYPKYATSISTRRFDYWGNEIATFNYSKSFGGYWNLRQPRIIELNNKPLIYDIYSSRLGYLPELSQTGYIDFLLLLQPELKSKPTNIDSKTSKYVIVTDIFGNHFIKQNKNYQISENINIKLYDLTGKFMVSLNLNLISGMQQIELPGNLPNGFYLVQIRDSETIEHHNLIK